MYADYKAKIAEFNKRNRENTETNAYTLKSIGTKRKRKNAKNNF